MRITLGAKSSWTSQSVVNGEVESLDYPDTEPEFRTLPDDFGRQAHW